jgi:NDP-sugar pyrophosphorylase family protein
VLNGDSLLFADLAALTERLERVEAEGSIVARQVADAGRYGLLDVGPDGRLLRFSEKDPHALGPGLINGGIYLFRPGLVESISENMPLSIERDVFPAWLREGVPITVVESDAPFLDIGTEASLAQADEFIDRHRERFS